MELADVMGRLSWGTEVWEIEASSRRKTLVTRARKPLPRIGKSKNTLLKEGAS